MLDISVIYPWTFSWLYDHHLSVLKRIFKNHVSLERERSVHRTGTLTIRTSTESKEVRHSLEELKRSLF